MKIKFHLVPVLIIACVGALIWSARNAPAATTKVSAPLIEGIRYYRTDEAARLARKCLVPRTYGWKPLEIPAQFRYHSYVVSRGNNIASRFAGYRCNDIDYQVRRYFGAYADQAFRVIWCESRRYRFATNGQYRGLFQMGSSERDRFGHGTTAYAQVKAAYAYFVASGKDWSPWECKP